MSVRTATTPEAIHGVVFLIVEFLIVGSEQFVVRQSAAAARLVFQQFPAAYEFVLIEFVLIEFIFAKFE